MPAHWRGYDEALILYLLALGSPTHPIAPECYEPWCSTHRCRAVEGIQYLHAGPLFIHQLSQIWCDLRGLQDPFMRGHDSDHFENSRRATEVQRRYAVRNPHRLAHMGEWCWGITACDGPGNVMRIVDGVERTFFDYVARGVPDGPDDGTLAPWAVVASFDPQVVADTIAHLMSLPIETVNRYGFKASFNPEFHEADDGVDWVSPFHFAINEGPTVLMIENHRSGLVWSTMKRCAALQAGLAGLAGACFRASPSRSTSPSPGQRP